MSFPPRGMGQWSAAIAGHMDITHKVVRVDPDLYRGANDDEKEHGLRFLALYGAGCLGKRGDRSLLGTAVYGIFLNDNEMCRVERYEIIDVEPELGEDGRAALEAALEARAEGA